MNKSKKNIFGALFFSIFTAVTGVGIVVPLLPVYAHDIGASGLYIGFIFGAFSLSRTFFLPYFGKASDRKGRKPYIIIGLLGYALVSVAFMLFESITGLIVIRFLQGVASAMIMPVTQAYIGDITPKGKEGFFMGLFNMSIFISLSAGPLIGGMVNDRFSLQTAFACMGILSFAGFLLSLILLPPRTEELVVRSPQSSISWTLLIKDKALIGLFIVRFVYVTCIGIIWCFLPVYANTKFGLSSSKIGILVMLGVCTSGILQIPMGALADRMNKKVLIISGSLITTIGILMFNQATGFWGLFAVNIIYGIGGGIAMPALTALVVIKGQETKSMGAVMALLTMAHSIGMLVGSIMAGLTMEYFQLGYSFPLGSLVMFIGIIFFIICTNQNKRV